MLIYFYKLDYKNRVVYQNKYGGENGLQLTNAEAKVMKLLWEAQEISALELTTRLTQQVGWTKSTAYTVLQKCVDKGMIGRQYPGFICRPLLTQEVAQQTGLLSLADKLFDGSMTKLLAAGRQIKKTIDKGEF